LYKQVRIHGGSGTVVRTANWQLADTAAYTSSGCFVCTHQTAALFCVKLCHGHHLKVWCHIENPTPSIDTYLLEETTRPRFSL